MYIFDDMEVETKEEVQTLIEKYGSIRAYDSSKTNSKRKYTLLEADAANLPTYDHVGAGSSAIAVDTGTVYLYDVVNKTWHAHAQEG